MKKLLFLAMAGAMFLCLPIASVQAFTIHVPTELNYYDTTKAYSGVTIFSPLASTAGSGTSAGVSAANPEYTYMIDMYGRLVNKWPSPNFSVMYGNVLENGHLLRCVIPAANKSLDPNSLLFAGGGVLEEADWYGNIVWSYNAFTTYNGVVFRQSHDLQRIWNKKLGAYTTIFVAGQIMTQASALALGAKTAPAVGWSPNAIYEVDMNGNIVWIWSFADHTVQNFDSTKPNYVTDVGTAPGRIDINLSNTQTSFPKADWNHINSVDYNAGLGQIVMNSRNHNEFYVIDHDNTFVSTTSPAANIAAAASSAGDFLYRFGAPMNYNKGAIPSWGNNGSVQIWGAHDIQWIRPTAYTGGPALPGAGHFIIWDNHSTNNNPLGGTSELKEINPYVSGKTGSAYTYSTSYVPQELAGYTPTSNPSAFVGWNPVNGSNQVVWRFAFISGYC